MRALSCLVLLPLLLAFTPGGPPGGPGGPHAGPPGGPHGPPLHVRVLHHADELGLTEEAREQIEQIAEDARATADERRDALEEAVEALREELMADAPDRKKALAANHDVAVAEEAMRAHRIETELAIRALLTPEQWATVMRPPAPPRDARPPRPGGWEAR